jgi:methyl-accepting chemotaxis protein
LLQTLSGIAPLFGLPITAVGFQLLAAPAFEVFDAMQVADANLDVVRPLILSVGAGALLAFIGKLLLHFAERRSDAVHAAASDWFDDCIWKHLPPKPQAEAGEAAKLFKESAGSLRDPIERLRGATLILNQAAEALQRSGTALNENAERTRTESAAAAEEIKELRKTAGGVVRVFGEIAPNIERATFDLAESSQSLKLVMKEQFGQAAARHQQSAEQLAVSVDAMSRTTDQLRGQLGSVSQLIETQAATGRDLLNSVRNDVIPAHKALHESNAKLAEAVSGLVPAQQAFSGVVQVMQESSAGLATVVRGVGPTIRGLAELDEVMTRMRETAEMVRRSTERCEEFSGLSRSLTQFAAAAESLAGLPGEIRAALQAVSPSANAAVRARRPFYLRWLGRWGAQPGRNGSH